MGSDTRLTDEFVVHDYHTDDSDSEVEREGIEHDGRSDVLVDGARNRSRSASALSSISSRLRGAASARTADSMIALVAESAAASADSLARTIEEDGLHGIVGRTVDFARSNSKAMAAGAAGLGLVVVEVWWRGVSRS